MICTRDAAGKNGSEVNVGGGGESLSPPLSLLSARGFAQRLPRPNKVTSHKATEEFYNKISAADKTLSLFEVCAPRFCSIA